MKKIILVVFALYIFLISAVISSIAIAQDEQNANLTIATIERQPFIFYRSDGSISGFSADLWDEIAKRNGWQYQWEKQPSFSAMIDRINNGTLDAAIANISITLEREKLFDFSHSYYDSGLQIVVPPSEGSANIFKIIWQSGAIHLIVAAIIVLLIIAHILWFFERNTPNNRHDYFRDEYIGGVWDAFWWAFIIMTMGGFEKEVPASKISRVLAMFWIIVSLFFVSTLTAKITTSLTVDQLTSDINSYRDLVGKKVGVSKGSAMARFLDNKNISYLAFEDFPQALAAVEAGKIDATIGDAPVMQYYVKNEGRGKVQLAGPVFQADKFGIALPTGSSLTERINTSLLEIKEDGTFERLKVKYFGVN